MDLDERDNGLIRALFWQIPRETEENQEKSIRITDSQRAPWYVKYQ